MWPPSPNAPRTYVVGETGTIPTARAVGTLAYASAIFRAVTAAMPTSCWRLHVEAGVSRLDLTNIRTDPRVPPRGKTETRSLGVTCVPYAAAAMLLATGDEAFGQAYDAHIDNLR